MIRFAHPWFLALIPLVLAVLWWRRRAGQPTVVYSSLDALKELPRTTLQRLKVWLPLLEAIGLMLLCVAMARPQAGREDIATTTNGVAIQLVIDRSDSMRAPDLDDDTTDRRRVTRLDVVKEVVHDFVTESGELPGRPQDLVGLVSFAGFVQVHCPLTLDHALLARLLGDIEVPKPQGRNDPVLATAMGDALVMAVERLEDIEAKSKVCVLLSDGRSNIGVTTDIGAQSAKDVGIKVYTVGVGTARGGLDETTLRGVAELTGGQYFNARSGADLLDVYRKIDQLERTKIEAFAATRWRDLFPAWVFAGLGLLLLHRLLSDTRFRGLP